MTKEPRLEDRVAALERTVRGQPSVTLRYRALGAGFVLLLLALVSFNGWLAYSHASRSEQQEIERWFWLLCHDGSTAAERTTAFMRLVSAGNAEWKSARLSELNLAGADLPDLDLQQANVTGSDLSGANLARAKLTGSAIQLSDLTGADLSHAELAETSFLKSTLDDVNFREANMAGGSLEQSHAHNAQLILVDLTEANLLMADLTGANLTGANLTAANLDAAILRGANLALARLSNAQMRDTDFTNANWWRAQGLPSDILDEFQTRFPPTEDAPETLQNDYLLWLQSIRPGGDSGQ